MSAVHVSREADAVVRVASQGPFSVGSKLWRDARGRLTCTVIAKATYKLVPGESAPIEEPCPIQEEDAHREDDRAKRVRVPSDLAPFKRAAEVIVVGPAVAPREAPSVVARVRVGKVDKSTEDPAGGLGAIASTWPARAGLLGSRDRAWLRLVSAGPMPPAFPPNFYQATPPDQWLDRPIAANEAIVLESLCSGVARLAMSLSGIEPRAVVVGPAPEVVRLVGDTLFVDTERGLCTLTFRGQIPFDGRSARVIVAGVSAAAELSPEDVRRIVELDLRSDNEPASVNADGARAALVLAPPPLMRIPTPAPVSFSAPVSAPLPVSAPASFSAPVSPPPPVLAPLPAPPPPVMAPLPAPPPVLAPLSAQAPMTASSPVSAQPVHGVTPAPTFMQSPPPALAPGAGPAKSARLPAVSFDAAFGGVKAASDAAIKAGAPAETSREKPAITDAAAARPTSGQRQAVVNLLSFDAAIGPRLRRAKRFAALFDAKARPKRAQGVDTPHQEPRDDRGDVLRVLSFGQPADAAELRRALNESLDDVDDLDPPLLLVAGELRPTFDEVEVLRATVAVVKQVASGDKKVLATLTVGQEALAAPIAPRAETSLGLVRQIEQAASALSLPPRYVPAEVERLLVEGRKYKLRTVLGAGRVRAEMTLARGGEAMPLYLPETAATWLPSLVAFPVVALCEILPREDLTETSDEALLAVALGRVLRSR